MQFNLDLQQMDVETAFLNARLTEEVYMEIPQGVQVETPYNCLKLNRALYGLKQSLRAWYEDIQNRCTVETSSVCKMKTASSSTHHSQFNYNRTIC